MRLLQLFLKAFGSPAMLKEEEFQTGAFPVFAQLFALAKNFGDAFQNRDHLMPLHKSIQAKRQMRIGGEPAAHAQGEANLGILPSRRIAVRPTSLISG